MNFTKVHGLGNDFLLFEDDGSGRDWNALAKKVCTRRLSVGADGIMVVLPSETADVRMRIINADGSEAEMCGNGVRAFAKYVYEKGIVKKTDMTVETLAGVMRPGLQVKDGVVTGVTVDMGAPGFAREQIPMKGSGDALHAEIDVDGDSLMVSSLLMGVPHTVVETDFLDEQEAACLGPVIEKHEMYPRNTNVNFVEVIDRETVKMRTWERGAGLTYACGTGACAVVVALYHLGRVGRKVTAKLHAGDLHIEYRQDGRVMMTGPATIVYTAALEE